MQYEIINQNKTAPGTKNKIITSMQRDYYARDGFLVLKDFIPAEVCNHLIKRMKELVNTFDMGEIQTIFSSKNPAHANQQYFLDSGDKIRFFFEEGAFNEAGKLAAPKDLSLNKVGHALHDLDPAFYCFSRLNKIAALCHDLEIADPQIVQSMYIFKQPHFGGEVTCHQDSTYLYVKEQPVTGLWIALEDATMQNGCLWAIPGGHKTPLKSRMIRDRNNRVCTQIYDDTPWPLEKMIPLEVPRGSLIVLNGLSPHMSKENVSDKSRHAYTLHVMSAKHEFAKENWLQRSDDKNFSSLL